jgi:hypothetical protein
MKINHNSESYSSSGVIKIYKGVKEPMGQTKVHILDLKKVGFKCFSTLVYHGVGVGGGTYLVLDYH